jgi:hypothetical protein
MLKRTPLVERTPSFYHQFSFPHDLSEVYLFLKRPGIHRNLLHVKLGLQLLVLLSHVLKSAL